MALELPKVNTPNGDALPAYPAYGRWYPSIGEVIAAWNGNKDFTANPNQDRGPYFERNDAMAIEFLKKEGYKCVALAYGRKGQPSFYVVPI